MLEIKELGFTHIQVSPIQNCRNVIGDALMKKKNMIKDKWIWWLAYQPKSFKIGNKYGTEDDFKKLINFAESHNIKIIVDIVINHLQASILFEYAIWNIILILSQFDEKEDDTENTMWDIINKFRIEKITTKSFIDKLISEKTHLEKLDIDNVDKIGKINTINNKLIKINNMIFETLYEQNQIDQFEYDNNKKNIDKTEILSNNNRYNNIDVYIQLAFDQLKEIICEFLEISNDDILFKDEYYDIITPPFWCSNNIKYGYNCWLAQALPQLNQKNKIVIHKTFQYLEKLNNIGIKCIRIDAASHIQPKILNLYINKFNQLSNNDNYIYSEVINPDGTAKKLSIKDYSVITHITEYNLLLNLLNIFCDKCDLNNLKILNIPSGDMGSVVFSTTHDLERIDGSDPALGYFGDYNKIYMNEKYKIILMMCYLLQRIYNVPLVFKNQIDNEYVKKCCIFRKKLYISECNREYSIISENYIFKSNKYVNDKLLGTFYMNISNEDKILDQFTIPKQGIFIYLIDGLDASA